MDRSEQWRMVAETLYKEVSHVQRRDGHPHICKCALCESARAYQALRDTETLFNRNNVITDPAMPPDEMRFTGFKGSEVRITNIGRQTFEPKQRFDIAALYGDFNFEHRGLLQQAAEAALRTQNANLEAQILAVPEEQREHYHIRVQMHADGSRTQHFERKDTHARPCACRACLRAMYSLDGFQVGDAITHLQKMCGTYYKDVSHLCLRAGDAQKF